MSDENMVEFDTPKPIEYATTEQVADRMAGLFGEQPEEEEASGEAADQVDEEIPAETQGEDEREVQAEAEVEEEDAAEEEDSSAEAAPEPKAPSRSEIELEMEREKLRHERQQAQAAWQQYLNQNPAPQPPKADLIDEDPMEYMRQNARFAEQSAQRQQAEQQLRQLEQQQYQDFVQEESGKLKSALPQLFDGEKGDTLRAEIGKFAAAKGYTPERLAWASAEDVKMLYAAMSYERLQSKAPEKRVELKSKPKVVKAQAKMDPVDPKVEGLKAKRAAFKKSGHVNDFAALLAEGDLI